MTEKADFIPRTNTAMRERIEQMVRDEGWSIAGRDPVRLERGVVVLQVRKGALIRG